MPLGVKLYSLPPVCQSIMFLLFPQFPPHQDNMVLGLVCSCASVNQLISTSQPESECTLSLYLVSILNLWNISQAGKSWQLYTVIHNLLVGCSSKTYEWLQDTMTELGW